MIQDWYELKDLLGIAGLPATVQGITKKAKLENWERKRKENVKGRVYEYHYTSFPPSVQQALGFTPDIIQSPTYSGKALNLQTDDEDYCDIVDFREIDVSAGFGCENEEIYQQDWVKVERAWLIRNRLNPNNCVMFKVHGDSMEPTLSDNEEIIVDRSKQTLTEGKIFVLNHMGTMWVKRVKINFDSIELISDNDFYSPIVLTEDDANQLNIIGQVVRGYRDF
ncbi:hypothetical protein FW755_03350 [Lonepinella koalarum]|uniref:Phage repressor protein C with HTH and peptisase S24 domain n=1 Tax=Lonepinella koalarum TaxID=53417 RepID=A0A4R1KJF9_9PAST|nr:S24 family peptidase [Lonepinella koalarum]MDH2927322.1 hypothetical protein [Lonepinella koalarum]TCK64948.1 phage repressor protein C with HTH and peptisase S24 domain [Lonepinella koalarum]TFJ88796.1 hypothetical protein E0709_11735 [Lonepinella koalarum]TYG34193.1 hypothetical protein FW755_03350 [Lonepinella koalarum]